VALVAGISPDHDTAAIEAALKAHDVDVTKVKIFTKAAPMEAHRASGLNFVYVVRDMDVNSLSDDQTKNMGIMGDAGGTGVPGLTSSDRPGMTVSSFAEAEASPDYLAGVAIPDDEVDNYNEAIDEGRAVATYDATGGDAAAAESAFKAAGLKNVRSY
jgi:rhodanese-related sulfurtransferase